MAKISWKFNFKKAQEKSSVNQRYYLGINAFLAPEFGFGKSTHSKTLYTIFMLGEIIDNFFYDSDFSYVEIEIHLERSTGDIEVKIVDNGSGFDPFDASNNCVNIRNASQKIGGAPPIEVMTGASEITYHRSFAYNLNDGV